MAKDDGIFDEKTLEDFLNWSMQQQTARQYAAAQQQAARQYAAAQQQTAQQWDAEQQAHKQRPWYKPPEPPKPPSGRERETVSIRMPFGKHKDTPIVNLPTDYLDWVLDWMDSEESGWMSNSRKRLFDELDAEYERRKTGERPARTVRAGLSIDDEARVLLPEFIKSGYRAMAMKCHPDKGGTTEQMVALKRLKEALEKL